MDDFLDVVWSKIVIGVGHALVAVNHLLAPLEAMGPVPVIVLLVVVTVGVTKVFSRVYTTKRYESLKKEFTHWYNLRQEAMRCEDREKGKLLAKNIDQGKLNRVYYDFFFEGMLKNILTIYLPCLIVGAYVNETYQPDNLMAKFGREHLFVLSPGTDSPTAIGALFFYVVLLLATYLIWFVAARVIKRQKTAEPTDAGT